MNAVDIVVPCYNYGRFLRGCVETVLTQQGVDVRVLIIDDCSPDNTREIGEALAAEDPRVTYRRHEVNQGFFKTIDEGVFGWASADYCLLLSADDALAPGALARAVGLMEANPNVGLTYGLGMLLEGEAEPHGAPEAGAYEARVVPGARFLEFCAKNGNPVPTPCAVVRTRLQHELGGYLAELPHTSDYEMWMRFAVRSDIGVIDAVQGYYRVHGAAMSAQYHADRTRDLRECMRAVATVVANAGAPHTRGLVESSKRRCAEIVLHQAHRRFEIGDEAGAKALVDFAKETDLPLFDSFKGLRLRAKLVVGFGVYGPVKAAVDVLRGKKPQQATSEPPAETHQEPPQILIGVWP